MTSVIFGTKPASPLKKGAEVAGQLPRITWCQLAGPPCQAQMEPCLDRLGPYLVNYHLSPEPRGQAGRKSASLQSPSRLRPAAIRSPGEALWASAEEGRHRLPRLMSRAREQSSASVLLDDCPQQASSGSGTQHLTLQPFLELVVFEFKDSQLLNLEVQLQPCHF